MGIVDDGLVTRARTGRAMGSDLHLIAVGSPALVDDVLTAAEHRIEQLESRWSRFRPDSELSCLNREGSISGASDDLVLAVSAALDAWRRTDARFDPTVLGALERAGYDRSFDVLDTAAPRLAAPPGTSSVDDRPVDPAPGPVGIEIDEAAGRVVLPEGVRLDLGGIGKGLAADLVATQMAEAGLDGSCANLGGDVRAIGRGPDGEAWVIEIEDPFRSGGALTRVAIGEGAVATSALVRRRWVDQTGATVHHLIDPATGRPAARGLVAVSVLAADARWAEVLTKAAFVAGAALGASLVVDAGGAGLLVTDDGSLIRCGGFERYETFAH